MQNKIIIFGIISLLFFIGAYAFPIMPLKMATHWNMYGQVDGYSNRLPGLSIIPILTLISVVLLIILPKIDPLKANIKKFEKYYNQFVIAFVIFMMSVYLQMILWNIGLEFSPNIVFALLIGALLFVIGRVFKKSERNWIMGIRTPWTLSSDEVWKKTHLLASKLFKISAVSSLINIFFPEYSFFVIIFLALIPVLISAIYSYFLYKNINLDK